jgi:hypothetical protein
LAALGAAAAPAAEVFLGGMVMDGGVCREEFKSGKNRASDGWIGK